eukprot:CAMPEP_0119477816 /NCGR_PEP_ID=MMETSP1344-20130328/7824_1 /TAXON_ID=236787 /ORGANISM="Florenciella parvula, Strain CCMP2471" /LENGTH=91 /DNA_ID=CAMNT_0007511905 /DNA_START=944 /DNA_END=1224 /DNA_ORIENTATION=-
MEYQADRLQLHVQVNKQQEQAEVKEIMLQREILLCVEVARLRGVEPPEGKPFRIAMSLFPSEVDALGKARCGKSWGKEGKAAQDAEGLAEG